MKRIVAILAGGRSRRMGGEDKALAVLGGARLIDLVLARLAPQADVAVISGRHDYETGLAVIADEAGGPGGPAAGVFAAARWVMEHEPRAKGFFTAPVDAPFLPPDLVARLGAAHAPAIAADDEGVHPTFAHWSVTAVRDARQMLRDERSISLRMLAAACGACEIRWSGKGLFANINTPSDLEAAAQRLAADNRARR